MAERDLIPEERREIGMLVYVEENKILYSLLNGVENSNWSVFESLVFGDGVGKMSVTDTEPKSPSQDTIWLDPSRSSIFFRDPENTHWVSIESSGIDGGEF